MRYYSLSLLLSILSLAAYPQEHFHQGPAADLSKGRLVVSGNQRFLQFENGDPFFYLGDTGWELFHRLSFKETGTYLENRRKKGFTVIQAVLLAGLDGLLTPTINGELHLKNLDPETPNESYFLFVDSVIQLAASNGLMMALLPTWGDAVDLQWGKGPVIFNEENAFTYGRWLGTRYKDVVNIIWIIGGDRFCTGNEQVWNALANGIHSADPNHLMTFHPGGTRSSSECFHQAEWLDFNMHQSGHRGRYIPNYNQITADYALHPPKPCMDGEPLYEAHPISMHPRNGISNAWDVRLAAYWSLFSGAHGHTYGAHSIWQFYSETTEPVNYPQSTWREALDLPGAFDMLHLRRLMESRPMLERYPDQSILFSGAGGSIDHIAATQGEGYAFVYLPSNHQITIDFTRIPGDRFNTWWYNPRTGESTFIETLEEAFRTSFSVPVPGVDWVLVIDNAAYGYEKPGTPL
ncbi:MAG: glycoside hydrolase family 140 protein [Bacteroidota bacterium]